MEDKKRHWVKETQRKDTGLVKEREGKSRRKVKKVYKIRDRIEDKGRINE